MKHNLKRNKTKRINRILNLLKKLWKKHPDLRLIQIISYFTHDSYYIKDETVESNMRRYWKIIKRKEGEINDNRS